MSNFSNVWKVLLYYLIVITLNIGVLALVSYPIFVKLNDAHVFTDFANIASHLFVQSTQATASSLEGLLQTIANVLTTNAQFTFNYIFLIVWLVFVFPFTMDLAGLAMGEVLYGFMTSKVKYGFTGRFIKNLGKSAVFSLVKYFVQLIFNVAILALLYLTIKVATMGSFLYVILALLLFACTIVFISLKLTLFSCWLPAIAVLNQNVFKALNFNFKSVFRKFFSIFSNILLLVILSFVLNLICAVFTFTVSLIVTLPLTIFLFVTCEMVSFFFSQGMKFYCYQDMVISPKTFEEQDGIKKIKYLV